MFNFFTGSLFFFMLMLFILKLKYWYFFFKGLGLILILNGFLVSSIGMLEFCLELLKYLMFSSSSIYLQFYIMEFSIYNMFLLYYIFISSKTFSYISILDFFNQMFHKMLTFIFLSLFSFFFYIQNKFMNNLFISFFFSSFLFFFSFLLEFLKIGVISLFFCWINFMKFFKNKC